MTAQTEAEVSMVIRARNGDKVAFEEVMKTYYKLVWSVSYPILKINQLVEDAVQETFVKVYREFRSLKSPDSFISWISTISRNVSIDILRKEQRKQVVHESLKEQYKEVTEQYDRKELVKDMLNELPENYRIPLLMKYIHGMDNSEIEQLLSMSSGSLRGILYRGRAMLRALMESELEMKNKKEAKNDQ